MHWPSIREYVLHPRERHANDRSAADELNWRQFGAGLPPGLELQWLGTAGFRISCEGHHLLIDPYLTRPGLREVVGRRALRPSHAEIGRWVRGASAVLVGHTHFDHALDVPAIARRFGCPVYGSGSLRSLMGLHGLAERAVEVEVYRTYEIGPFRFTFVPSVHSKLVLGVRVPAEGELTCEHLDGMTVGAYRCGQVYGIHVEVAGVTFYHQGSADLIDDAIVHRDVDFFLAGIAGRGFTPRYTERILRRLSPRVVVPHHHDNFFRPLGAPMGFSLNVNFGGFVEEVHAVTRDVAMRALAPGQTVSG